MFYIVLWHTVHLDLIMETASNGHWSPWLVLLIKRYWLWHEKLAVPGLVFLSGYFGKGFLPASIRPKNDSLVKMNLRYQNTMVVLVFGCLLVQLTELVVGTFVTWAWTGKWVTPPASLPLWEKMETWYLVALLLWRISTPMLFSLKQPLIASLLLALASLHTEFGGPQDVRIRVLHFLPYYVAGLLCDERHLDSIPRPRYVGSFGVFLTLTTCFRIDEGHLGHMFSLWTWDLESHFWFLFQYVLCGSAVVSVILLVKAIPVPLFPYSHSNSTLAIYEWHWPLAGILAWGQIPYTNIKLAGPSIVQLILNELPPLPAMIIVHIICYVICVALGSAPGWRFLRFVSEPNCKTFFHVSLESPLKDRLDLVELGSVLSNKMP
jgi:hypothetical protein